MTVQREEAVRVSKGQWVDHPALLSNVYGEQQLVAELAAMTAVAVTGRLELVRLLDDRQFITRMTSHDNINNHQQ